MKNDNELKSIEEVEAESNDYAKSYYRKSFRNLLGILTGAFIFLAFNPSSISEFVATLTVVLVPVLWGAGVPKKSNHKLLAYFSCILASTIIYFTAVI